MAKSEARANQQEKSSPPNFPFGDLAALGAKRADECLNVQTEFAKLFEEVNRQWVDRVQSEADLASNFAAKLTASRSIPDAMTAWQEWTSRRLGLMGEDGSRLLADTQKFAEAQRRLLSIGWLSISGSSSA